MAMKLIKPIAAFLALGGLAAMLAFSPTAEAQTEAERLRRQIELLQGNIATLNNQLQDLQRYVFTKQGADGGAAAASAPAATASTGDSGDILSHRLAVVESRLDQMEQEKMRRIDGQFDELRNLMQRMDARIEKLVADVDFRLTALESAPPAVASADTAATAEGAAGTGGATSLVEGDDGYKPSGAPRILGTIPLEDDAARPVEAEPQQSARATVLPEGSAEDRYKYAFGLLRKAQYDEAADVLSAFIEVHAGHPLVENASYWRGETFYARKLFGDAARIYATNLQTYPEGNKAPDNMVKLGMSLANLDRANEACQAFEELERKFPDMPANVRQASDRGRARAGCS